MQSRTREKLAEYEKHSQEKKWNKKGYVIPNEDEVFLYGYKEPLKSFEEGYGYKGALTYSKEKDMVQCHFCGRMFRNVGIHAAHKHKITEREYKERVELQYTSALVGEGTREKLIEAHKDVRVFGLHKKDYKKHAKEMSAKATRKGHGWPLERKNKHGLCPDQLLDKIKGLYSDMDNKVPSARDFRMVYTRYYGSIIRTFGTWNKAIEMAGLKTYKSGGQERHSKEKLLEYMRIFYQTHKRTPRNSDMARGYLPRPSVYIYRFGNLNEARLQAGVPILIPVGHYWREVDMAKT